MENLMISDEEVQIGFPSCRKGRVITPFLLFSLAVFFLSLMTSCSENQRRSEEGGDPMEAAEEIILHVALWTSFPTLDWQSTVSHPLPQGMLPVFEGLFGLSKDFVPVPELAETWHVSDDKLKWTFDLRQGIRFHNGRELTAEDVKSSLERWRRVSPRGVMLNHLREIVVTDKYTVLMEFDQPIGRFLLLILAADESKAVIMPKEVVEASPRGGALSEIVGTGPYQFEEYRTEQYLELRRFEDYVSRSDPPDYQSGAKAAHFDRILFWIVPEASTRVAGLERREYDIVTRLPDAEYKRLLRIEDIDPIITKPALLDYLIFNHRKGPFANIDMRRAVQSAIDVEEVSRCMMASEEFWTLNPSIYPPESPYNTDEASQYYNQNDSAQAREFMQRAGYAGEPVKFLVLRDEPEIYRASIAIGEQLKAVGIKVDLLIYDLATWVAKRANQDEMDMFISKGYWLDPSLFHAEFGGRFPGWFISDDTEEIFSRLAEETDFEKRFELGKQLQRLFYEKAAFINVSYHYGFKAKRSSIIDPEGNLSRGNLTLHNVEIER
jgi:peptide/nickel transport system substrate-binding protein